MNGAPLLAVAMGTHDGAAAGLVFAATMLVRAPVYVFQGFAASLLANLTHLVAVDGRSELLRAVLRTAVVLFSIGIAFIAFVAFAGPAAMRAVYGPTFDASAASLALLAAGVACYLAAGTFSQALLAPRHVGAAAVAWTVAAASFVGLFAVLPGGPAAPCEYRACDRVSRRGGCAGRMPHRPRSMRSSLSIGIVGLGEAGGSFAQAFDALPNCEVRWLCDSDRGARMSAKRHPQSSLPVSYDDLLGDETLDAVVLATPLATHRELVDRALRADKHVLVANPLARTAEEALVLADLARERARCLLTAHAVLFHPALRKLKEIMETGRLGETFYLYGNRQDFSRARRESSALWSLGVQDIAALLYLVDDTPVDASCWGETYVRAGVGDIAFWFLRFATG